MTPNPVSLSAGATLAEAAACLTAKGISGAPVVDERGRPVGVLTQTDLFIHARERPDGAGEAAALVLDVMTPAVFTVPPETPLAGLAEQLCAFNVHRLFVVDRGGVLVGVVSALDVLRALCPPAGAG
jgi:CBS domain-containing protein